MGANVNIFTPSGLSAGVHLAGGLDLDLDNIHVTVNDPLPVIKLDTIKLDVVHLPKIVTESKVDVGLDIRIKELPKIELEFGFKPTRVHLPTHYQMCFSVLGKEVFKFALCGESMVAIEPYVPHQTEKCG